MRLPSRIKFTHAAAIESTRRAFAATPCKPQDAKAADDRKRNAETRA